MTRPPRTQPRHVEQGPAWVVPSIIAGCGLLVLILAVFVWTSFDDDDGEVVGRSVVMPTLNDDPEPEAPVTTTSKPDLVANARKILPLEDISNGDRVLYQGHLCYWREWQGTIAVSKIECGEGNVFQVPTGRLTPVELKTAPSKLKINHP